MFTFVHFTAMLHAVQHVINCIANRFKKSTYHPRSLVYALTYNPTVTTAAVILAIVWIAGRVAS